MKEVILEHDRGQRDGRDEQWEDQDHDVPPPPKYTPRDADVGTTTTKQEELMKKMHDQLNTMMEIMKEKASSTVEALVQKTDLPFSSTIMACPLPLEFRIP